MSVAAGSWVRFGLIGLLAAVTVAVAAGALLLSPASPAGAQSGSGTVDYDTDGDNLIEVSNLAQLNAIRYDLDGNGTVAAGDQANYDIAFLNALASMGCAATCTGYELDADLDFNTDTGSDSGGAAVIDAADDYHNLGSGWEPLGDSGPKPLMTTFEGNNHTISNLFINRTGSSDNYIGLFGQLGGGSVRRVHLVDAKVTGNNDVGALVGHITLGTVSHSSSSGTVSGVGKVGGLVGTINSRSGTVEYSRSSAVVTATGISVGGLVGSSSGRVRASYATGAVTGLGDVGGLSGYSSTSFYAVYATGAVTATGVSNASAGGLVGGSEGGIYASYSTGAVTSASGHAGGLLKPSGSGASVGHSYWDVTTTSIADDNNADTGEGKTTLQLQSPTQTNGYAGIYANWDIDVDSDSNVDDPWDFGTASQYPALKADSDGDGRATAYEFGRQGRSAPVVDYDTDDNGLIEVSDLDQLNAMRWDLDGNGAPALANANDYALAFPTPATGMGCVLTDHDSDANSADQPTCIGYELTADLNFDTDDSGDANSGDTYWDGGAGWAPIGVNTSASTKYNAVFDGAGHTISNLFISRSRTNDIGLFGATGTGSSVRSVGLLDVDVTGQSFVGALVGHVYGEVESAYSTGSVSGDNAVVGGLAGYSNGTIMGSYSAASVTAKGNWTGGLVGNNANKIIASYATGSVNARGHVGGLAGILGASASSVAYSYATGAVTASVSDAGGLVGSADGGASVTHSYWDTQTSTQASSAGGVGKTTDDLQRPTDYTGIYLPWSVDIDDADGDGKPATGRDAVWDFGTSSQYPALRRRLDFGWYSHPGEMGLQGRDNSPASFGIPPWMPKTFTLYTVPDAAAGTAILPRLTYASDPNRDPLTYTLTGTDAASFELAVEEGFPTLKHKSGVVLTVRDYTVEVNVSDGKNAAGGADASVDDTLTVTVTVGHYVNYDSDGDGLIEIDSLVKLNAMRWDTTGNGIPDDPTNGAAGYAAGFPNAFPTGCRAETCRGYELTADLNFNTDTGSDAGGAAVIDASDAYWNNGAGWEPIGPQGEAITMAEFKGNGHVIRNLFIDRGAEDFIGLFGYVGPNVDLLGVGLEDPNVKGRHQTGALAGRLEGRMTYVFVEGGSVEGSSYVGGLAGWLTAPPDALPSEPKTRIAASYASASVLGANLVGGLVGIANNGAVIAASYAAGTATCECTGVSGLVGAAHDTVIVASYSLSGVDGGGDGRGLVANSESDNTVTDSYWNTLTSGKRDAGAANVGQGKTTAELRTPTDYAGIYADWDVDLDNGDDDDDFQTGVDNPWDFGTAGQYPVLKVDFNSDGDATINEFGRQRRAAAANRAPVFTEGASAARRVKTGTATGTAFGAPIAARDPDGDTLVYALGGTDAAHFAINSSSGQLSTDGVLDMSAKNSYTVTVSVHDGLNAGGNADTTVDATITVTINVVPINSPPVFTYGATYDINAVENRTSLGVIPATDPDGDTLTYAIDATTGDHGDFEMDGHTLQFKTAPDFEAQASYTVVVTVRDSKNAAGVADSAVDARITVTVTVLDVDEPPGPVTGLMAFGKDTAIDVEWTAPDMAGKPPVTGYTVQSQQWVVTNSVGAWGAWQDHVHAGVAVTATITGLTNGDTYMVGVRATNAEGASVWRQAVMATPTPPTDYDADNDGLIDAGDRHALYGIRWDLNGDGAADLNADRGMYAHYYPNPVAGMGCPSGGCTGYELTGDIDLSHLKDPWWPMGDASAKFSATFDGKGHTISGLRIVRPSDTHNGLFGAASSASVIRNVGLLSVDVAGGGYTGALAGLAEGTVESVYVTGAVSGAGNAGGLVGALAAGGSIARSYAAAAVTGTGDDVGGLAGSTAGGGSVKASYATGAVSGANNVGGLIGNNGVTVTAAYSTGSGGRLVGANTGTITHSYWDMATSGQADDSDAATGVGKTTLALKAPTQSDGYAGIYANWNLDLDGTAGGDDPWDFGTASEYPALKVEWDGDGTPTAYEFGRQGRSAPVANGAPTFGVVGPYTPDENQTAVGTIPVATDPDAGATLTYQMMEGAGDGDHALFTFVPGTRVLTFKTAPNFENPPLSKTTYTVKIRVRDSLNAGGTADTGWDDTVTVTINLQNVNEAPAFGVVGPYTPDENQTAVGTIPVATDPDAGATLTYQMMEGASDGDHALFTFVPGTRVLTFKAAPNFEIPPSAKTTYTVKIRVRDSLNAGGTADTGWDNTVTVTINLQNVNEAPAFGVVGPYTPDENQTAVGTIPVATDPDAGATLTYQMMEGASDGDHALFTFVPGTRVLTFKAAPNFEIPPSAKTTYTVKIRVRDSLNAGGTADTGWDNTVTVTINLQNVNEAPAFGVVGPYTPDENQTAVGTIPQATDPENDSLTYEMMSGAGDGDHALFTFVPGTRVLTFKAAPNYEATPTKTTYTVKIRVRDSLNAGGTADTGWDDTVTVTINLQNVNEAPAFGVVGPYTPDENQTAVGTIPVATDPDAGATLTYQMMEGASDGDHALFTFVPGTRVLTFKAAPNFEIPPSAKTTYTVKIRVRDSLNAGGTADTGWDDTVTVTINLQNVNEAPAFGVVGPYTPDENQTAVGTIPQATDPENDSLTYEMMSGAGDGDHALFTFVPGTRVLTFKAAPNYEATPTKTTYTVKIRVRDSLNAGGTADTGWDDTVTVTINLQNVNEAPAFGVVGPYTPDENQTAVGTIPVATDPDAGATLTYQMMEGASDGDHALFTFVPGTRVLTFKAAPNFEIPPSAKTTYTVKIRVRDSLNAGGTADTGWDDTVTVTINLQNVNEAPAFGVVGPYTPDENQTAVGTIPQATDPENDSLTYEMMSGAGDGDHALFTFVPGTRVLTFKAAPNYEATPTKTTYTVKIRVRDSLNAGGTADTGWDDTVTVTINLQNVNEAPAFGVVGPYTPDENQTAVGTIPVATDPDAGATLTYEMMMGAGDGDHALFTFVPGTRVLTFKAAPNFENPPLSKTTYTVKIRVQDSLNAGGTADTGWDNTVTVTINLQNVNEAPAFGVVGPYTPDENQTAVGTIPEATDPDAGATLTYEMMMGAGDGDHALFTFVPGTRVLTFKNAPNFEATPTKTTYTVKIRVRDSLNAGGTADTGWDDTVTVTINLQDVNEEPEFMSAATTDVDGNLVPAAPIATDTRSFREDAAADAAIGAPVAATDPDTEVDPLDTLTYALAASGDHASFAIDTATGQLKTQAGVTYDYEAKDTYTVTVTVHDGKNAAAAVDATVDATIVVTINVTDARERWTPPTNMHIDVVTLAHRIRVSWTAPAAADNTGKPALTGYKVQWRQKRTVSSAWAPDWVDFPRSGLGTTTDITTHTVTADDGTDTTYIVATGGGRINEVRVCSLNEDGAKSADNPKAEQCGSWNGNALPAFTEGTKASRSVAENTAANTNIGNPLAAADSDAGDTLVYSMTQGTHSAKFTIDTATGQLKTKDPLDHETAGSYDVYVKVNDGNNGIDGIMVTITVTDVNEPPAFDDGAGPTTRSVSEGAAAGDAIGDPVEATDPDTKADPLDTLTYALDTTTGDHANLEIDTGTGQLKVKDALDYETKSSYTVTVQVRDSLSAAGVADTVWDDTIVVNISVGDVNEAPVFTAGAGPLNRSVAENAGANANVGLPVPATDVDDGDSVTLSMSGTGANLFSISSTGQIKAKASLDYETAVSYAITVTATDTSSATDTILVNISVTDVDEPPTAPTGVEAGGIANGLRVTWTAPDMAGKPAINGYDVEHALRTAVAVGATTATWGAATTSAIGVVEAHDITGLTPDSTYRVRVRAKNGEGDGVWSSYVNGVPTEPPPTNMAPSFDDGASTTRSVAENTAAGTAIGNPIAATDTDAGDTLVYAIDATTGDHAHFAIDSATGQLKAKGALDYESGTTSYSITVTVSDGRGGTDSIAVTITVTSVNEAPVFTAGAGPLNRSVAENAGANANVGLPVPATDVDDGDSVTLSLSGTGANLFSIDSNGQIKAKASLDYETAVSYAITVTATDTSSATDTILVNISVTDVDEPPTAPTGVAAGGIANGLRVTWTAPVMTNKPTLDGYDVEYSLRTAVAVGATPATWGAAVITDAGLVLTHDITGLTPDSTYRVRVRAKNAEGISGWSSYDTGVPTMPPLVNADPTFGEGADTTRSVAENTAAGTAIGNPIAATDTDATDTLVYAIDATTGDHGHFAIDSTNGQLKVKSALDYESNNRYTVVVTVSDGNGGTDSITVTIDVDDVVNEAPVVVPPQANVAPSFDEGASASRNVAENTPAGRNIGSSVGATDHDNDVLRYELEATGDHGHFAIDSSSGQLKTKGALDYESKSSYAVTVIVWDGNGGTDSIPVTIRVTNVDDTPTVTPTPVAPTGTLAFDKVGVARRTVDAYAPVGTAVGAPITATVSAGMAGPFYSVYTRSSPFIVDRLTGQLRTARKLGPADEYTIQLLAADGKGRLDVIGVIITVTGGRANRDPVFREGASATRSVVAGSSQGVRVGRPVTATDPDGDALFYMVSGTDSSHFSIGSGSGQIKVGRPLTKSSYSFEVVVGDLKGGVDVLDITITVTVTAVDAPPVAPTPTPTPNRAPAFDEGASAGRSVAENTPAGRNIGLPLAATDPDSDSLTYALGGADSGHFALSGNQLRTYGALDYEGVKNSYLVTVTVSDGRGGTDTIDVAITVTNVDEAPPPANRAPAFDEGASAGRSVAENTPAGRNIGLPLAAADPDSDSLTYALSGADSGHFALSGNQLRTSGALDYEGVKNSYSVTVTVSDGNGGTDSIDVTITVTNVDEAPVVAPTPANRAPSFDEGASAGRSVAENAPAGTDIGLPLAATDPDSDSLTYALSGADSGHFALSGNQLRTSGDYEGVKSSYSVTVYVSDGRGGTDSIDVTVTVTNVDEAPVEPTPQANRAPSFYEGANTTRSVAENTEAGQDIGLPLVATDPDDDSLTYALGGTDSGHFALSGNRLQTSGALDYEGQNSYSVTVNVSDGNGGSDTAAVTITVTNVNEPPGALPGLAVFEEVNGIRVSWSAPDMTGKPPITGYDVQYKLVTATTWNDHSHSGTGTTIQGLTAGSTYNVRVRAKNDEGNSVWASAQATPTAPPVTPVPPGAITNLEVTPGWSKLGLTWNMPDMTGKPPITHYEVQYKLSIDKYWGDFPHDSTVRRVTIDFLGGGLSYDVRVRAVNSAGSSDWVSSSGTTK